MILEMSLLSKLYMRYEHVPQFNGVTGYENNILIISNIVFIEKELFYNKRNICIRFIFLKNTTNDNL